MKSQLAQFNSQKQRNLYFEGAGTDIIGALSSKEAMQLGGLNYEVVKKAIVTEDGIEIPNRFATVRTDTNQVLGVVGKNYNIVQNEEGFDFIDDIISEGAQYECAGTYDNGKGSWICAKTDPIKILDDDFDPYILFTNSFDGTGTVKAMFTPVRTFCSNCFVRAEKNSKNKISIRHSKDVKDRLSIAKDTLLMNSKYLESIKQFSEDMATTQFTKQEFVDLTEVLIPIEEGQSEAIVNRQEQARNELIVAYNENDLQNFNNSAYKALMAVSDFESHRTPLRDTKNPNIYLQRVMAGMVVLNTAINYIKEHTGYRKSF